MWESRVLRRAFERLELHEGKLSRAVLRGGGGGDVTSLPDTWVGNHPGLPGFCQSESLQVQHQHNGEGAVGEHTYAAGCEQKQSVSGEGARDL